MDCRGKCQCCRTSQRPAARAACVACTAAALHYCTNTRPLHMPTLPPRVLTHPRSTPTLLPSLQPYLFRGPRPVITSGSDAIVQGQALSVKYTSQEPVTKALLLRTSATTHSMPFGEGGQQLERGGAALSWGGRVVQSGQECMLGCLATCSPSGANVSLTHCLSTHFCPTLAHPLQMPAPCGCPSSPPAPPARRCWRCPPTPT